MMSLNTALSLYNENDPDTDQRVLTAVLRVFRDNEQAAVNVEHVEFVTKHNLFMTFCEVFFYYTQQVSPSIDTLKQHNITRSSGYGTSILKHHRPAIEALSDYEKIAFLLSCDEKTRWRIAKLTRKTPFAYNNTIEDNILDDNEVEAAQTLFRLSPVTFMPLAKSDSTKTALLEQMSSL